MAGHDGNLSTSLTLGLGLLAATMTLITAGSVGLVGFMLGRQIPQQETESFSSQKRNKHEHENATHEQERHHRLRIPSGTASEDVKITDKKAIMDVRISGIRPLIPPAILLEEIPLTTKIVQTINRGRQGLANILRRLDDRLVVVVGPCSIHDTDAAMDYAKRLLELKKELNKDLLIVMRVYFEKPRTTVGWKGLINDPDLDGSFNINKGLRVARELLAAINELGLPAGCEFLDTMSPQFISDLVSWGAIGARTTECQLHRELCSGLSMPIGFKNGTGGDLQLAVDAVVAAKHSHCFLSVSSQGLAAIVNTSGNDTCHLILRGGKSGPNFEKEHVDDASARMLKANLVDNVMIDCSHGNSQKKHKNQVKVAANIADQLRTGDDRIVGVMLESNIEEGNQPLTPGKPLVYGKSVTDACMGWETTVEVLRDLAAAVRERRAKNHQ
ncbi:Phospho-2-dehydro-3-deoxyheptonate aldolase [Phytophthora cactorum]|uniref:3-deoxy-7-phosphoheptulonate synthase n=1 Tax=Phytophthora cactorum TaxID=29920 RepID=A0A329SNR3_9STRA|nr:Phospho-2-dehydro-3-deoxyheptonate aldolase [Phytophthora cactorum]KAG2819852.1 Phospho-2-dehydro-3-deoxyheptonate aldolase [Phytophthora cactorum]KAG2827318.1 Phospho-2-dehydro-3-deoxyheptonate aldolase [Phytophthora cactorum]KAG2852751.1 Phospho-2-dehydro-3-deoxyheptonate aldolase [Phytophthora cactorum]KAG2907391.1 Phospho-2-dehydro-3-deoxyheptonate aldolase [Phytophthora cactorum]